MAAMLGLGTFVSTATNVHASNISDVTISSTQNNDFNYYYNDLSNSEKIEFDQLAKSGVFSQNDQLTLLQEKYNNTRSIAPKWKIAAIKKLAVFLAAKTGAKSISDITNFLFSWEDDLQEGATEYLVNNGWNHDVAYWTVKSAIFLFF